MSERMAVVTGAGGGIGAATATLLRELGWRVIGVDVSWPAESARTEDSIELDVADGSAWEAFLWRLHRLDSLVNNAAVNKQTPLGATPPRTWRSLLAVNFEAAALATNAARALLARTRGSIVNVASVHAFATVEQMAGYASTKAALLALTRAAAVELGPDGIRVNAVAPGAVDSPMLFADADPAERDRSIRILCERTPLGRVGAPREIAEAIAFLADPDRAGFITGQCLIADGGALARLPTE